MQRFKKTFLVAFSLLTLMGLQACEESTFEETGEEAPQAVDEAEESFENAGDELE